MREQILEMGKKAREASHVMATAGSAIKREALEEDGLGPGTAVRLH